MFETILNFFREKTKESNMRLNATIITLTGCYVALAGLHLNKDLYAVLSLSGGLLTIALTGKAYQKAKENNETDK